MNKWISVCLLFTFSCKSIQPKIRIIADDVVHFIQVMDSLEYSSDTMGLFQRLLIDQATEEFKPFMTQWGMTSKQYTSSFRKYPKFYKSLLHSCQPYLFTHDSLFEAIKRFKQSYPNFHPATICMGIGTFRTGGNMHINKSKRLVYIGLEFHAIDDKTDISEIPNVYKDYLSRANVFRTAIHELVHIQQFSHGSRIESAYSGEALYIAILREGIAEYIARQLYPYGRDGNYWTYGIQQEPQLRKKLKPELYSSALKDWLYHPVTDGSQPSDMGYFMGARIAEAYHKRLSQNAPDFTPVIEIMNLRQIIDSSEYFK